jgi:hypothetical protein
MLAVEPRSTGCVSIARSAAARPSRVSTRPAANVGRWRKRKGIARVQLSNGTIRLAEIHWYEAHGIGRHELKIKEYLY